MVNPVALAGFENSDKSCPQCGSAEFERVTDPRSADRLICLGCGLVYMPDEWLRGFYKGLEK